MGYYLLTRQAEDSNGQKDTVVMRRSRRWRRR